MLDSTMYYIKRLTGMGLTKQYLRYTHDGTCNVVASSSGTVAAITDNICAVSACENVHFYNMKIGEKVSFCFRSFSSKFISKMLSRFCRTPPEFMLFAYIFVEN